MAEDLLELKPELRGEAAKTSDGIIPGSSISRICHSTLSYNEFYWSYMNANWPVLLTEISNEWKCLDWLQRISERTADDADNNNAVVRINFDYLKSKVVNCSVPVADCSTEYFNSHAKSEMCFHDFLDHWQARLKRNSSNSANTNATNSNVPCESTNTQNHRNLYLKDWHLKALMPDYDFYRVPKHFASDWLNEKLISTGQDDYRFVYMGPKDTWTPFHADVFGSYSWSTNIMGCKKWIMLPPGEELKLCDRLGNLPFYIDETKLQAHQVHFFTVLQRENEALFVPSGWYHQVWNLTDTISVNHNWFNACNVGRIWRNLRDNMQQVVTEINDCRQMDNFDEHCQTMLRAAFGINYLDFLDMLEFIVMRRINDTSTTVVETATSSKCLIFDKYSLNDFHIRHDLRGIRAVIETMLEDEAICNSRAVLYRRCLRLEKLTRAA